MRESNLVKLKKTATNWLDHIAATILNSSHMQIELEVLNLQHHAMMLTKSLGLVDKRDEYNFFKLKERSRSDRRI